MEGIRDGTPENGEGLTVQGLQSPGGEVHRNLSGHKQIHVENELNFLVCLSVLLHQTGSSVDLRPAAAPDSKFSVHAAAGHGGFLDILLGQRAQITGRNQLRKGSPLQPQVEPGDEIQVPQADTLEISGLIDPDKGSQGLVQLLGKLLPAHIVCAAQGNKFAG